MVLYGCENWTSNSMKELRGGGGDVILRPVTGHTIRDHKINEVTKK
jgi:hypothetical protein